MAVRTFGKTWWGKTWVCAMERIDRDTNRLPRGRSYANYGMVKSIEIESNGDILAKVQGRLPKPYNIKISLKKFTDKEIKTIKEIILNSQDIIAELILGKLPAVILNKLEQNKIFLLPNSWEDIQADCSCPDWANPCKHLAAVYYIIANEIDKNPFIVFNLHNIKTEELLSVCGLSAKTEDINIEDKFIRIDKVEIASIKHALSDNAGFIANAQNDRIKIFSEEINLNFDNLDINSLFSLLPDNPLFYTGVNFKKILHSTYKNVMENIQNLKITEEEISLRDTDFYIIYNEKINFDFFVCSESPTLQKKFEGKIKQKKIPIIENSSLQLVKKEGTIPVQYAVMDFFLSLPLSTDIEKNSPSTRFLNTATSVALSLVKNASFAPEIIPDENNNFYIRYVPLLHCETTKDAIYYLCNILPPNLIFREKDKSVLIGEDAVWLVLSIILSYIVHKYNEIDIKDKICDVFFKGREYRVEKFEERQTAKSIQDFLEPLRIRKKDISPVIRVEPKDSQFEIYVDIENKKDILSNIVPLFRIFEDGHSIFSQPLEIVRTDILKQITIAGEYFPKLKEIIANKGRSSILLSPSEMADFIIRVENILNLLGIKIIIPKELKKLAQPQIVIKSNYIGKEGKISYFSLDEMLDFSWEVALGDKTISKEEFLEFAKETEGLVKFKDEYVLLAPGEVKNIIEKLNRPHPRLSSMEILRSGLTGEFEDTLFKPDEALKRILDDLTKHKETSLPKNLKANLRPYQERGFRWLYSNTSKGFGCCIADDMGLGKTLQVITLILKLKEENKIKNPSLVVCPTTIVGNWQKEIEKFAPSLSTLIYHGQKRKIMTKNLDLIITSYGTLRRDIDKFSSKKWGLVIVDEAQNIKNPDTDQTKAVKQLHAKSYIAMTGTPVENRLTELWSIYDFVNRGYLGSLNNFVKKYSIPIEKYRDKEKIEKLKKATSPFLLRRLKTDKTIITDLPEKSVFDEYCYLTKEQTALYKKITEQMLKQIEISEKIERRGLIFKLITSLKQICNHPVSYLKKGKLTKEHSGKTEKLISLIEKIFMQKEKLILFTQYREMGELLVKIIEQELKEDILFFHGGLQRTKRDKYITEFQEKDKYKMMLISLKAGGTGLNLTSANNVIHYDLWWNPAVEEQATDRTYRIGQKKNVIVYRLITIGTFEEKIDEMIKKKKELADLMISVGENWITELSNEELKEIFSLG